MMPREGFFGTPAVWSAIATAWRCGRPAAISVLMLELIVFWDFPDFSGIGASLQALKSVQMVAEMAGDVVNVAQ